MIRASLIKQQVLVIKFILSIMMVLHGSGVLPGSAAATAVPPLTLRNSDTHWRRRFAAPAAPQMFSAANAHSASTPLTVTDTSFQPTTKTKK